MKISHIIGIIVIAAAVGIIITSTGDASTYMTFGEAQEMSGNNESIHVVGQLKKNDNGEVVGIHPSPDKLSFSFIMVDENQQEQMVYYGEPMPPDFLRSEQVVVIGSYTSEDMFTAEKILLKCPSKYQEETIEAKI